MKKEEILEKDKKGYDFKNGKNEAVVSNRRYKVGISIPDHLFLLHKCSFKLKVGFNKRIRGYASFSDFFETILKNRCNLSGHLDNASANACDVVLSGKGLNPDIIHQLLHKKCVIKSITAFHIEVKAFPHPHALPLLIQAFKDMPNLPFPWNRIHKFDYDFWVQLDEYKYGCYQLTDGTSYGKSLEIWFEGEVEEQDFSKRIELMVSKICEYSSSRDLRLIDEILSPTNHRPAGILIETLKHRNKVLATAASEQIQNTIRDVGIVTQDDFEKAYSYLGNRNSVNKMKFRKLAVFKLIRHSFTTDPAVVSWVSPDFIADQESQESLLPSIDFNILNGEEEDIQ